jgi:magnesium chelatase subunit I
MTYQPTTLGELIEAGYRHRSVRDEMRENLLAMLARGENPFPGILGYDRTVVPALVNAVLARHDLILLGLRGQAKTRILRALVNLLDAETPVIVGSDLNESPFAPFTRYARNLAVTAGPDVPVAWLPREERYREKLATPDVTIADLIGDVDPVKAATLKKTFADEEVIHYGIVPRTNRGIFAINELPDLAPRIQVGLLNILEERDLQIRGFPVRIPLDVVMVFSANPEDYTNRGNIITPLKDRIASQILTHYPRDVKTAKAITDQEAWSERGLDGVEVRLPDSFKTLVEEVAFVARRSDLVDQGSGVSARMPIAMRELLVSNMERRAVLGGEKVVAPRLVDLFATLPAITGKVEMVFEGEQQGAEIVARKLIGDAVKALFEATFPPVEGPRARGERARRREADEDEATPFGRDRGQPPLSGPYERVVAHFTKERKAVLSDETPFARHLADLDAIDGLAELVASHGTPADDFERAFLMELVLEGLVQSLRIAREDLDSTVTYAEMARLNLMRSRG